MDCLEVGHRCLRADPGAGLGWLKSTESSRPVGRAGGALGARELGPLWPGQSGPRFLKQRREERTGRGRQERRREKKREERKKNEKRAAKCGLTAEERRARI